MIYITGDCHGDWRRFSANAFPAQQNMCRDDYVIVLGDFGLWHKTPEESWWLDNLAKRNFTLLFIDGNHENFDRLNTEFPVVDFHGGKAHQIRSNIYHLMRGYVFDLDGSKFFVFGGAKSHDITDGILEKEERDKIKEYSKESKLFRINHVSWWQEEMPNAEEMSRGLLSLEENNWEVDFIISHCAPQSIASSISHGEYEEDALTKYFDEILNKTKFCHWMCGHYHTDLCVNDWFTILYRQIVPIENEKNNLKISDIKLTSQIVKVSKILSKTTAKGFKNAQVGDLYRFSTNLRGAGSGSHGCHPQKVLIENLTRKESAVKTFNQLNNIPILFELVKGEEYETNSSI